MKTISFIGLLLLAVSCQKEALQVPDSAQVLKEMIPVNLKQVAVPCDSKIECKELLATKLSELQKEADRICKSVTGEVYCCSKGIKIGYSLFVNPKSGACFEENLIELDGPKSVDKRLNFNIKIQKYGCFAGGFTLIPIVLDEDQKGQKAGYVFRWVLDDQPLIDAPSVVCSYSSRYTLYVTRISDLKTLSFQGFIIDPIDK